MNGWQHLDRKAEREESPLPSDYTPPADVEVLEENDRDEDKLSLPVLFA